MIIIGQKYIVNFQKTKHHVHLKAKSAVYEFLKVSKELPRVSPLLNYIEKILDYPGGRPYEERVRNNKT